MLTDITVNNMVLKDQTAIVTGGSRGIGAAICARLASLGANIVIIDLGDEASAGETMNACAAFGVTVKYYRCNVTDFAQVKETVSAIKSDMGPVHILVNNAGITRDGLIAMMSEKDFDDVIDVNLKGAFNMIRHCAGLFIRNHTGKIINISSVAGLGGNAGQINYSASKAGLVGMTKTVAKELASKGVTCNAVAPGFIATNMTQDITEENNPLLSTVPLRRMGTPEDVANTVAFLACSPYITGEVIRVDGGVGM